VSCSPQFFQIQIFELQSLNKGKQISGGQSPLNINKEKIVKEKKSYKQSLLGQNYCSIHYT